MDVDVNQPSLGPVHNHISLFARGMVVSTVGSLLVRTSAFVLQIMLARLLGLSSYGIYSIGNSVVRFASTMTPLGLAMSATHYINEDRSDQDSATRVIIERCLLMSLLGGSATALLIAGLCRWLAVSLSLNVETMDSLTLFVFAIPLLTAMAVAVAISRASGKMAWGTAAEVITAFLQIASVGACFILDIRLQGVILATICCYGIGIVVAIYGIKRVFRSRLETRTSIAVSSRQLLTYGFPVTIATAMVGVISYSDRFFLASYWPPSEIGIYQAACQVSSVLVLGLLPMTAVFPSIVSQLHFRKDFIQLGLLYKTACKWSLYVSLPVFVIFALSGNDLLSFCYGPEFRRGRWALLILALAQLVNTGTGPVIILLQLTGYQTRLCIASGAAVAVALFTGYWLVPRFGTIGAAIAYSAGSITLNGAATLQAKYQLKLWPYDARLLKGVAALSGSIAATLLFEKLMPAGLSQLLASATASTIVFVAILLALGIDGDDRELLGVLLGFRRRTLHRSSRSP